MTSEKVCMTVDSGSKIYGANFRQDISDGTGDKMIFEPAAEVLEASSEISNPFFWGESIRGASSRL